MPEANSSKHKKGVQIAMNWFEALGFNPVEIVDRRAYSGLPDFYISTTKFPKLLIRVSSTTRAERQIGVSSPSLTWMMRDQNEQINSDNFYYCFVYTKGENSPINRFFAVPSSVVANYISEVHKHWSKNNNSRKEQPQRFFSLGFEIEDYTKEYVTPLASDYESAVSLLKLF